MSAGQLDGGTGGVLTHGTHGVLEGGDVDTDAIRGGLGEGCVEGGRDGLEDLHQPQKLDADVDRE